MLGKVVLLVLIASVQNGYGQGEYENSQSFVSFLLTIPEINAINLLTVDLNCAICPREMNELREELIFLVDNHSIDLRGILVEILPINYLNRQDLLMNVLMRIDRYFLIPSSVRFKIRKTLWYFQERHLHSKIQKSACCCQVKLFHTLLRKLIEFEAKNKQLVRSVPEENTRKYLVDLLPGPKTNEEKEYFSIMKNLIETSNFVKNGNLTHFEELFLLMPELMAKNEKIVRFYRDVITIQKFSFNYFIVLESVPEFQKIMVYFYTPEFLKIMKKIESNPANDTEKLILILELLVHDSTQIEIIQISKIVLKKLKFQMEITPLIALINQPKTPEEEEKYFLLVNFLKSNETYNLLQGTDFSIFPNAKLALEFVFTTMHDKQIPEEIKKSIDYYSTMLAKLKIFEFVKHKEIKKKFNMTEIFIDSLDPQTLTSTQKQSFREFLKFMSEADPETISSFEWDQAKTRSQFMKLLFKHLLESEISPEIKHSILVLAPLVKTTGKALLPP